MAVLGAILGLFRSAASPSTHPGPAGRRAWASPGRAPVIRVRSCYVCGGDPRHLCFRCREVTR
jgi:hypothetical protein